MDVNLPAADLADRLTMLGLEVDAVEPLFADLDKVVVAKIEKVEKHPNADKLTLCDVSIGTETKRVVCGAPNVRAGMLTALALPGAVLPGNFKVKPAKIRGEASDGMLCSEKELKISEQQSGIMDLPPDYTPGQSLVEALELSDTLIEVDLTPNRPDCTSVIGVAREIAGISSEKLNKPIADNLPKLTGSDSFTIEIQAADACPRYSAKLLKNVKLAPSPWWLQRTLLAVGLRPINNVVDITNFVMLEYGQPLHAFDFAKLSGAKIIVRKAVAGEKITTLDGTQRKLDPEMLLICDDEKPVAVAGVMGAENSEVNENTTEVLLESAYFNPISIRKTNRKLNLGTDASYRFERGIDPMGTVTALERASQLICEICGAEAEASGIDVNSDIKAPAPIKLRVQRTSDLLGVQFSAEELSTFLNGIEIKTEMLAPDTLQVFPPSFRVDLEREADLVEEIARLYGYNNIPTTLPVVPMSFSEQEPVRQMRNRIAGHMAAMGFVEAINYSFIAKQHFDLLGLTGQDELRKTVELLNPLSEDQSVMRTTLLSGLLDNVRHNVNRQNNDVRIFEIGKVFHPKKGEELPDEIIRLAAVFTGRRTPGSSLLHFGEKHADILDVIGTVEQLCTSLNIDGIDFKAVDNPPYASAGNFLTVSKEETILGVLGTFERSILENFGIKQEVFFLDLNITQFMTVKPKPIVFAPLSKFPAVKWDLAVVVPESVGGGDMIKEILASKQPYIVNAEIFDIYRGKSIEKDSKSVAIKITYHSIEQTLDDDQVKEVHQQIIDMLLSKFDGQLREI